MNDLSTILDDASAQMEVREWFLDEWLAGETYDHGLADSDFLDELTLPFQTASYLVAYRKNPGRRPQKMDWANSMADPASGSELGAGKEEIPIDFLEDWAGIGTAAQLVSPHDLERWCKDQLHEEIPKRTHELTQNAMKVGRFQPGVWGADGTASTPFDTTQEATVTINGHSFTFKEAHHSFVGSKPAHNALEQGDRFTMVDFDRAVGRLALKHAPRKNGLYRVYTTASIRRDLCVSDEDFRKALRDAKRGANGFLMNYGELDWYDDDMPFTESWDTPNVRATNGPIHTAFVIAPHSVAYLRLGKKSSMKPTFTIQAPSKVGAYKTAGYMIPFQVAVIENDWCETIAGPVSIHDPDAI